MKILLVKCKGILSIDAKIKVEKQVETAFRKGILVYDDNVEVTVAEVDDVKCQPNH